MLTLLFAKNFQLLGELTFTEGKFTHCSTSAVGEPILGPLLQEWQLQGIPVHATHESIGENDGEETRTLTYGERRILLTHSDAEWAFACWAGESGKIAYTLPDRLLPQWEKLSHLDLAPEERFLGIQALLTGSHAVVQAWDKGLDVMLQKNG